MVAQKRLAGRIGEEANPNEQETGGGAGDCVAFHTATPSKKWHPSLGIKRIEKLHEFNVINCIIISNMISLLLII